MSRRKRHSAATKGDFQQIEWLKHRTGFPSPEEREKIIRLRKELNRELITFMVMRVTPDDRQVHALSRKYTAEEVERAMRVMPDSMELPSLVADDAGSYRDYRRRYARFGAGLKFYTQKEMDALFDTHKSTYQESNGETMFGEADKLLLFGWRDWEDITPPAIPPRPHDFSAPQPAAYPAPINELLDQGDELNKSHQFADASDFLHWRKHIPALTRMALDPGLLNGWPTEPPSWAPWHAIHALGALQAWDSVPALAALADLKDDWLSDHLSHIWADMGAEAEPSLWMILENPSASAKQRGLAANSLYLMTEDNEAMEHKVVNGFDKLLRNTETYNRAVNAYMIHFLREMEAVDEVWETIESAFDDGRVNSKIITPEDLADDEFDEEDFSEDGDDDIDLTETEDDDNPI